MFFYNEIPVDEFEQFVISHNLSHFTQLHQWGVFNQKSNCKFYRTGIKNNNNEIVATALILEKQIPFTPFKHWYIPYGFLMDYSDLSILDFMVLHIKEKAKSKKVLSIKFNPRIQINENGTDNDASGKVKNKIEEHGFHETQNSLIERDSKSSSLQLELSGLDFNFLEYNHKYMEEKECLSFKVVQGRKEDFESFVQLARQNKKISEEKISFVREIYTYFSLTEQAKLYMCEFDFENSFQYISKAIEKKDFTFRELSEIESKIREEDDINRKLIIEDMIRVETELQDLEKQLRKLEQLKKRFKNRRLIAASLLVFVKNKAWCVCEIYDNEIKKHMSNFALQEAMIKDAQNEGCQLYEVKKEKLESDSVYISKWGKTHYKLIGEFECILYPKINKIIHKFIPEVNFERGML